MFNSVQKRAGKSTSRPATSRLGASWRAFLVIIVVIILLTTGCSMQSNEEGFYTGEGRVKQAEARATDVAVDIIEDDAEIDRQIRLSEQEAEREAHLVAVEATKVAYTTQMSTTLTRAAAEAKAIVAQGDAKARTISVQAEAKARTMTALGNALSGAIYIAVFGLVTAMAILALGRATADVRSAVRDSSYVRIGVEPSTMLPPPLVIADGYLIDTRSGERARLRDTAGVDRLRLAATTHTTEVALLAAAEKEIAKQTASAEPGDALMGVAGNIPLLDVGWEVIGND